MVNSIALVHLNREVLDSILHETRAFYYKNQYCKIKGDHMEEESSPS